MDKKYGILVICAAILFLCFLGVASAKTWYVDDDLQEFPYADFTKIQDAVNIALPGDTIIVYNGTYYENIDMDKRLNLTGIGMPIVNASGEGSVITLRADDCVLTGFKVTGSGEDYIADDAGVRAYSDNNLIKDNDITNNNQHGIFSRNSKNNTITQNDINNCYIGIIFWNTSETEYISNHVSNITWLGIFLSDSVNNNLSDNIFSNNYVGILLEDSEENTVANNSIIDNYLTGIELRGSNNNVVINNEVRDITQTKFTNPALDLGGSTNILANNTIANCYHGIGVSGYYNQIYHNNFINNTEQAYDLGTNIWDNGYPSSGNYWSDYTGEDNFSGLSQNQPGSDGIGDTPYWIPDYLVPNAARDKYPFICENGWLIPKENIFDTDSPQKPYPSISGTHNGTIIPSCNIDVSRLYIYPCTGTGGHTEYVKIWNSTDEVTATWDGYQGDWHNITFNETFVLYEKETYNYTIRTGSYPQIHHNTTLLTANGWINCTEFRDANGKVYPDWIPAIRLE